MVEYQKSAGLIVYYKDKDIKFLLLKYPSYWGLVKGLTEENENIKEAAKRELEEETGIRQAEIIPGFEEKQEWFFKLEGKTIKKQAVYFLAETSKEQAEKVKISHEHDDFAWCNFNEVLEKMKIKANKELMKKAYKFVKEFEKQKRLV